MLAELMPDLERAVLRLPIRTAESVLEKITNIARTLAASFRAADL